MEPSSRSEPGTRSGVGVGTLGEAIATATGGAVLGFAAGLVAGPLGAMLFAVVAGTNGLVCGARGTYDWRTTKGWLAFVLDSTWGIVGTALGLGLHLINSAVRPEYRRDLSRRRNVHVFECGVRLKTVFAFTLGHTISNAGGGGIGVDERFLSNHEELHVWQGRWFGPLFQLTYVVWGFGGALVATGVWMFNRNESWAGLVETAAYYDNPFEYWAYKNDGKWPPRLANRKLTWPG